MNGDVLRRPNVRLHVDDGRNVLLLTPERYDAVTADIIQPHHAGAGSLYSAEYFRLAQKVLGEGGIMVQWISLRSEQHYELILRTFLSRVPGGQPVGRRKPRGGLERQDRAHAREPSRGAWPSRACARRWRRSGSPTTPR